MNLVAVVFDFESLTEMPLDGLVENLEAFLSGLPGWILENLSALLLSVLPDRIPENFPSVFPFALLEWIPENFLAVFPFALPEWIPENFPAVFPFAFPEQLLPLDDRMFLRYLEPLPWFPCPRKSPGLNPPAFLAGAG